MIIFKNILKKHILIFLCLLVVFGNGCFSPKIEQKKPDKSGIKQHTLKTAEPAVKQVETKAVTSTSQGTGYLSNGSTVSVGVLDGDEEIKILEKIRRLERALNEESEKQKTLAQNLADLKAVKEKDEKEFTETKKELEEINTNLSEDIKLLKSRLKDLEEKLAIAELEQKQLKEKLLKTQIAETKAQQELFKLKIDQLEKNQEAQ